MSTFNLSIPAVIWTLESLDILLSGNWPDPDEDPQINRIIKGKRSIPHAYYEDPILLAVEVQARLKLVGGLDSYLVEDRYIKGISVEDIAEKRYLTEKRVRNGIHRALLYMEGVNRKPISYREWKFENKNKREVRG